MPRPCTNPDDFQILSTDETAPSSPAPPKAKPPVPYSEDMAKASKFPLREFWEDKKARLRRVSPFGSLPNWNLYSVIYKHGDDLRQEQLAIQLIKQFHNIFQDAGLPLYLKPYHILVTSGHSGLIEVLTDAVSLHQLKKEIDGFTTLSQWFKDSFHSPSRDYSLAQRNFVESLAGYSIVTHLLAIKDRHNGNILIDAFGRIIHIDYGFMLTNSPGFNMNFESAPFKLTQEYIDVMEGIDSSVFQYFKALLIRGFIEARKHAEKIACLVDMMLEGSVLPCFARGEAASIELRERFCQNLTEDEYLAHIEGMIEKSCNNWNTRQYDKFQYLTNGIMI
ncbi:MAG: phosphatidylinositol 4-kinase [archaeon]|nr:phosphatidylinositol 4-kinase [archaeon]